MTRSSYTLIARGLLILVTLGCVSAQAQSSIKIGVIAPFNTPPGEGLLNAAKGAASDINAAGGIRGRPVELVLANDDYKPSQGAAAYRKLVLSDRVVAVVGTASSGVSLAIMDQMTRYRVPMISTGASSLELSDKVKRDYGRYRYWFRVGHTTADLALSVSAFVIESLQKEKRMGRAAILSETANWTRELVPDVSARLAKAGITVVSQEGFDLDTKDFKPILAKTLAARPDFIIDFSSHVDGSIYIKQWGAMQGPLMVGVNTSGTSSRFWNDTGGDGVSHIDLIQGSYRAALTPLTIPWYDQYLQRWKVSPDYTSGYTRDAIYVLKAAIEKAGTGDVEKLVGALEATDYVGVSGRWVFAQNHDPKFGPGFREMGMTQWNADGTRTIIWPAKIRTGAMKMPPWHK